MTTMTGATLHQVLRALGFEHRPAKAGNYARTIVRIADGAVVFTGRAHEVWSWLRGELEDEVFENDDRADFAAEYAADAAREVA